MGLGIIEILVLFIILGGVALALRGGSAARKWLIGGMLALLACGVLVGVGGLILAPAHTVTYRAVATPAGAPPANPHRPPPVALRTQAVPAELAPMAEAQVEAQDRHHVQSTGNVQAGGTIAWWVVLGIAVVVVGGLAMLAIRLQRKRSIAAVLGGLLIGAAVVAVMIVVVGFVFIRPWRLERVQEAHLERMQEAQRVQATAELRAQAARLGHVPGLDKPSPQPFPYNMPTIDNVYIGTRDAGPVVAPRPLPPAERLPEWVAADPEDSDHVVVAGEQFASRGQSFQSAIEEASVRVMAKFHQTHPDANGWHPGLGEVQSRALDEHHTQKIVRSAGENNFTVFRTYLLVDRSSHVMAQFERLWRADEKKSRSVQVGVVAAALTGFFALLAGFFRLNDRTKGRYRWPLAGATALGGILLAASVPVVAGRCAERCRWQSPEPAAMPREAPRQIIASPRELSPKPVESPPKAEPHPRLVFPMVPERSPHRLFEH